MSEHKCEPWGAGYPVVMRDNYSIMAANCLCGNLLMRETAPVGARYNWEDWKVVSA